MTLWLLDTLLIPEEEAFLAARGAIAFPSPLPDLAHAGSVHDLHRMLKEHSPDETPERLRIDAGRLWDFLDRLLPEDKVALVCGGGETLRLAEIAGPYAYDPEAPLPLRHRKPVRWLSDAPLPLPGLLKDYRPPLRPPRLAEISDARARDRILAPIGLSRTRRLRYIPWVIAALLALRLFTMALGQLRAAHLF